MPDGLSLRATILLVALAFGLTFAVQALLGGGSPAAKPAAKQSAARFVADTPGATPDLRLVAAATVPALREPKQPPKRKVRPPKPTRSVRRFVKVAPRPTPAPIMPAATVQPTPIPTPQYVAPAPQHITPKPVPTSAPPASGKFDNSGTSGEFDSSGGP
jgi:hypothetical protein